MVSGVIGLWDCLVVTYGHVWFVCGGYGLDVGIEREDEWLDVVIFGASWTLRVLVFTFHYFCY